ncbi:MAG: fibronectin type III domain-containing protein, partial [Ignavibacteriales bacterium]|nr:fibronectin type III domain-containing protein [Ignavibacteriales bacterium]
MKKLLLLVLAMFLVLVFNSCKESNTEPAYTSKVEIIAPANNQRVSDTFYVALGISNLENINKIEYYVDKILHGTKYYPPLTSYPVIASQYQDSSVHEIYAKVYTSTNAVYESQTINVITLKFMPSNLTGSVLNDSTLRVVWQDNSRFESGYDVFLSSDDTTYSLAATVKSNTTECTLKGKFTQFEKWYVKVRAVNGTQQSAFAKCTVVTFALTQPQITSFTTVADSMCEIKWTDNNNFEDNYIIEISGIWQGTVSKNSTSAVIKCTLPVNSYLSIRVGAKRGNAIVYSYSYNQSVNFYAPWSLKITPSSVSSVKLQWEDASTFEAGFQIERKLLTQSLFTQIGIVGPNVTSYTDNTADTSQQYTYRVRAYTTKNNYSAYSSQINAGFGLSVQIDKFIPIIGITNTPSLLINNKVFAATSTGFKEYNLSNGA